jgi:N12 class adenine-specific DNA methylase
MTISKLLCLQGRRLSLVAFCLLSVRPLLSAQTGKELMADACYNEVHQRDQNALWASRVQRHTAGHVYLEEEIETVDGPIHRLISLDGHEPSHSERKQEDARLHDVAQNPKARLAHSDFKPVASDTNIARALQQLGGSCRARTSWTLATGFRNRTLDA